MGLIGEGLDSGLLGRMRDDEYESRSGSDNFDGGASGDELDGGDDLPHRRKRYHRHTPNQIQELEKYEILLFLYFLLLIDMLFVMGLILLLFVYSFFKECPHPDEKQRMDLSRRLGLENKQVKFWFQNRRTQMKVSLNDVVY